MSVQKLFFGNALLIVLLNLLIKPFYLFGIDAQVQNVVGTADYGLYFSLLNLSFLFNMTLDMGLTNYNTRNIAQHPNLVSRYIGSIIGIRVILGLVYATITIGAGFLLHYSDSQLHLLSFLVLNQFLAGLLLFFRSNFAGLHLFKTDALLSVLDRVLLIGVCLILLYSSQFKNVFKIEWFVYAQTFSYGVACGVAGISLFLKTRFQKIRVKRLFSYALLKKSYPYALLVLLMMLYTRIDAVMLERLLSDGKTQSGIYAQGFRLLDAANIFGLLIAGLLLPIFSRLLKQKETIVPLLNNAGLLLIGASLTFSIITSLYAFPIFDLIYKNNVEASASLFPWIIFSFIPICGAYLFGTLLTANGNLRLLNSMAITAICVNTVLNFVLIPSYKAEGAAIATLITQVFAGIFQALLVMKVFKLTVNFKAIGKLLFQAILLITSYYLLSEITSHFLLSITLLCVIGFLGLFLFGIVSAKGVKEIVSKRSFND